MCPFSNPCFSRRVVRFRVGDQRTNFLNQDRFFGFVVFLFLPHGIASLFCYGLFGVFVALTLPLRETPPPPPPPPQGLSCPLSPFPPSRVMLSQFRSNLGFFLVEYVCQRRIPCPPSRSILEAPGAAFPVMSFFDSISVVNVVSRAVSRREIYFCLFAPSSSFLPFLFVLCPFFLLFGGGVLFAVWFPTLLEGETEQSLLFVLF